MAQAKSSKSGGNASQPSIAPTQEPPAQAILTSELRPVDLPAPLSAAMAQDAPRDDVLQAAESVTAWVNSQKVTMLWGVAQNRNSWMAIAGVGWKRLSNATDSGVMALTILAAHARQSQTTVNYREEADGMVHEMYVW
jgi:hypothetical protein